MSYELIDSGDFAKLEQVGPYRIVRPSPQAVWPQSLPSAEWQNWDARFDRFAGGDGRWLTRKPIAQETWTIDYCGLKFDVKLTDFGHLGIFPEHLPQLMPYLEAKQLREDEPFKVLNLFAYTGAVSLLAASQGALVTHVDASKASVSWARSNANHNGFGAQGIRWIVEDVRKFVTRELRRGSRYHAVVLDPPSYGRGTKSEIWKIEEDLVPLLQDLGHLLADDFSFLFLSSHSHGYSPLTLENLVASIRSMPQSVAGGVKTISGEMLVIGKNNRRLPCGAYACLSRAGL